MIFNDRFPPRRDVQSLPTNVRSGSSPVIQQVGPDGNRIQPTAFRSIVLRPSHAQPQALLKQRVSERRDNAPMKREGWASQPKAGSPLPLPSRPKRCAPRVRAMDEREEAASAFLSS